MRAPQYGQTSWQAKRRTNNAALPADTPVKGYIRPCGFAHSRTLAFERPGQSTIAPVGHKAVALYGPTKSRVRYIQKRHTKVSLQLWHKTGFAMRHPKARPRGKAKKAYIAKFGSEFGPPASKQRTVPEVKAISGN